MMQNLCPTIDVILHQGATCHVDRRRHRPMSVPPAGVVPSPEPRPGADSTLPGRAGLIRQDFLERFELWFAGAQGRLHFAPLHHRAANDYHDLKIKVLADPTGVAVV